MKRQIIYILGDVHGNLDTLNAFIDLKVRNSTPIMEIAKDFERNGDEFEVFVFQVGDMAYFWPRSNNLGKIQNRIDFLHDKKVKIYWCGGNHDDWDQLDALFAGTRENIAELEDGFYFCRFGATLNLFDGQTVLFAGGAESVDKDYRLEQMRLGCPPIWWPQEGVLSADLERLDYVKKADIVISHTAPMRFNLNPWLANNSHSKFRIDNTSRKALDIVLKKYDPQKWFFGHFHEWMQGKTGRCEWLGLADILKSGSWSVLDIG